MVRDRTRAGILRNDYKKVYGVIMEPIIFALSMLFLFHYVGEIVTKII
jgi:hypothetical protein